MRRLRASLALLSCVAALGGCAGRRADRHAPPFARVPYQPFSRDAAIAIALREWRAFGSRVDDAPPDPQRVVPADQKPERADGLWQRVGEYWWGGLDAGSPESAWTGRHDGDGRVFPAESDGDYAWSAAFVSYVMRSAGGGDAFPYAPAHWTYVDAAYEARPDVRLRTERPESYAPQPGDLICMGREASSNVRYDALPVRFPGHCDIVVDAAPGELTVVGGNVDDAVTLKHVPVSEQGTLATPDGAVQDVRYRWFVVVRVLYDR